MKLWQYITAAVLCFGCFILGAAGASCYYKQNPEIKIKWLTETKTIYTGNPQSLGDYEKCYKSPLVIDAKLIGKELEVSAEDSCKRAERKLQIDITCPFKSHMLLFQPILSIGTGSDKSIQAAYGGMISYLHFWPVFGFEIGLGAGAGMLSGKAGSSFLLNGNLAIRF